MKHTPGKWFVEASHDDIVKSDNGSRIAFCYTTPEVKQYQANAQLIAAAPDLLEACKAILNDLPELWGDEIVEGEGRFTLSATSIYQLEQAISKVKKEV